MAGCQQQPARNSSSCQQEDSPQHRHITHSCSMVNNNFSPQFFYIVETAGVIKVGTLPPASKHAGRRHSSELRWASDPYSGQSEHHWHLCSCLLLMSVASIMTPDNQSHPSGANYGSGATGTVVADPGIPAIKKWLADRILTGECTDLAELLPAKGRSKNLSGSLEGQVVLMHAANDLSKAANSRLGQCSSSLHSTACASAKNHYSQFCMNVLPVSEHQLCQYVILGRSWVDSCLSYLSLTDCS